LKETKNEGTNEKGLTPKQTKAIAAILEQPTMEKAAIEAGVPRRTLYNWLEIPAFKSELEKNQRLAFTGALARLQGAARLAAEKLIEALDSKNQTERRLAASQILELSFKAQEIGEFSEQLAELAERISGEKAGKAGIIKIEKFDFRET